jgi:hypothetical protein
MARPPKLTPDQIEVIRDARRSGASAAEIARELRTPLRSVQRALAGARSSGTEQAPRTADDPLDAAPTLAALGAESVATGRDALEIATAAVARVDAVAQRELAAGNVAAFATLLRQQTLLVTAVRQLEAQRANADRRDGVFFTKEELQQGAREVTERLRSLEADRVATGGWVCTRCGESLRMADASAHAGPEN